MTGVCRSTSLQRVTQIQVQIRFSVKPRINRIVIKDLFLSVVTYILFVKGDFLKNKLLLQPYEFLDSESNGCHFSSLASPGDEKKLFSIFLQNNVTSRRRRFFRIF